MRLKLSVLAIIPYYYSSLQDPGRERHFVLIHAPWDVLAQNAERIKLKVPLQVNDVVFTNWLEDIIGTSRVEKLNSKNPLVVHDSTLEEKPNFFMAQFVQDHLNEYVNYEDKEGFFSVTDRNYIVQHLLQNARFARGPNGVVSCGLYSFSFRSGVNLHRLLRLRNYSGILLSKMTLIFVFLVGSPSLE